MLKHFLSVTLNMPSITFIRNILELFADRKPTKICPSKLKNLTGEPFFPERPDM